MYCTQCGAQMPDDAKFCAVCGTGLLSTKESRESSVAQERQVKSGHIDGSRTKPLPRSSYYFAGIVVVGPYAVMLLMAFLGIPPDGRLGLVAIICTALVFSGWWKQRSGRGWIGALLGVLAATGMFILISAIAGMVHAISNS
jgi:hypothetical protein